MKIDVRPNLDQIRFFAHSAMHAWDYQDLATGRAQVIADMEALLAYLDALNDGEGVAVASVTRIEEGVRIERSTREGDFFDLAQRYMTQNTQLNVDNRDCGSAGFGVSEHRMRTEKDAHVVDGHDDFGASVSGPTKR